MLKFILIVAAIFGGFKYGGGYLLSEDFQQYADRSKSPWTCYLDNTFGDFHMTMSNYQSAYYRFSHSVARCPDSSAGERAQFEVAHSLELAGDRNGAALEYDKYVKKYPETKRARIAQRSVDLLRGP